MNIFQPNYYTLGSLISTLFLGFISIIILRIPNKSRASLHLGICFAFMTLFNFSYVITHGFSQYPMIITRWVNIITAMLGALHITQFMFSFPETRAKTFAKVTMIVQYALTVLVGLWILYVFYVSKFYFLFNAHFWDSLSLTEQKYAGVLIFVFFLYLIGIGIWRTIVEKGAERRVLLLLTIAFSIVTIVPGVIHVLSRDGLLERSAYMTTTVIMNLIGFFIAVIIYINTTKDKTKILARLIGISVVTVMLIMQAVCILWLSREETLFDQIHSVRARQAYLENVKTEGEQYSVRFSAESGVVEPLFGDISQINQDRQLVSFKNSAIYYQLGNLPIESLEEDMQQIPGFNGLEFAGYRGLILHALQNEGSISTPEEILMLLDSKANQIRYRATKLREISAQDWNKKKEAYLKSFAKALPGFAEELGKAAPELTREQMELNLQPVQKPGSRIYRGDIYTDGKTLPAHYVSYINHINNVYIETGYDYNYYRNYIAASGWKMMALILLAYSFIIVGFRYFYGGALLVPIGNLVKGLGEVNSGNLDVRIDIQVEDEIGFMARNFNSMTQSIKAARKQLQEYAEQLEHKVEERTRELQKTLDDVQKLKQQQDGDYFLTTLLLKPLGNSRVESQYFNFESVIHQKKQFSFRHWSTDIGGDINIAHRIHLHGKPHIAFVNADAMGKSIQGAGGALVLGSVYHTIIDRTSSAKHLQNIYPERWLKNTFIELHKVFESFDGSMLISGIFGLLDEELGLLYFVNCEHPSAVLYRDKTASFIPDDAILRKLGTSMVAGNLRIQTFQMEPGDVLILGSDGRDDLLLGTDEKGSRIINEDEQLFLKCVENADGNLDTVIDEIFKIGQQTDDLSLMRIERLATPHEIRMDKKHEIAEVMQSANAAVKNNDFAEAIRLLENLATRETLVPEVIKSLARLYFHVKDYEKAAEYAQDYLFLRPADSQFVYFASLCYRQIREYEKSIDLAERLRLRNHQFSKNLGLLADLHLRMGNLQRARDIFNELEDLDPDGRVTKVLKEKIEKSETALENISQDMDSDEE